MLPFSMISVVVAVVFLAMWALIAWLKYREHLHAHRREWDEHGHFGHRQGWKF